jgi:hypothetical protein
VPLAVVGEIYIGGAGVACGYRGQPQLSAQRFVEDPFHAGVMYRTGDLGRWKADGTIEFLGRNDDQVKIRGFRIELGEIEAQIACDERVREVAVVARGEGAEKHLVAYVVSGAAAALDIDAVRARVKAVLPDYMVPTAFVTLEALPLTPSGKLNRRALPAPDLSAVAAPAYEPPQGEVEQLLAQIWQQLLRVPRVGRSDNFFELGGHSLLATRVTSRVSDTLEVDLPLRTVFEKPTVRALAEAIVREIAMEVSTEGP